MTNERFDMTVATWLNDEARQRMPDHLDAVLAVTARTRQRPAWSSLERWLPMETTLRPATAFLARPARIGVLGALLVALVALIVVVAGALRDRVPQPFGPARNGVFVTSQDGDLYRVDPVTADKSVLVGGDPFDFAPFFSRDGSQFAFLRSDGVPGSPAILTLMLADADGTRVRALTEPLAGIDWFDWSPDGSQIAYNTSGAVNVVDVASGTSTMIDVGFPTHFATWLPPDGEELLVRSEIQSETGNMDPGIFAIHLDGTVRKLTGEPSNRIDFLNPAVSPDGLRIMYTRPAGEFILAHVLDVATATEVVLPNADGIHQMGSTMFSPDGSLVAYTRTYRGGGYQVVVAPANGNDAGTTIGPRMPAPRAGTEIAVTSAFTPDGTALITRFGDDDAAATHLLPIDGSPGRILGTGSFEFIDVQRLAP